MTTTTSELTITSDSTTSMSSIMTQVPTTITLTNSVGSIVSLTSVVSTSTVVSTPVNNATTSSNTGAIVGGVIGGIGIIGLLVLLFSCIRRRRRNSEFDRTFDPDRVVSGGGTLPHVDLHDDHEVTPLPYPDQRGMRQYGDGPYLTTGIGATSLDYATSTLSSPSHYSDTSASHYPMSVGSASVEGYPSQAFMRPGPQGTGQGSPSMHAMQQADWRNSPLMTTPLPSVSSTSAGRVTKEMEAQAGLQSLWLAPLQEVEGEGSGVVQHQDAGRALSEGQPPRDIPPAYDSIRQ
ncbi:hypothetical protein K503DRAFT_773397 [Rhizopogon vinicolor AM-OR11-026]|uniref:Mid2 domain-containing protein n=1 Tax=Rhizopogon vinicolor AM-OR11-026 TaxID=1314800 RepID=A0A1B7MSC5_9AGAM|nr:hypothetical protein K503DRAFT_773397 [Rhizopogon vinicolor AM-OR11-026]